MDFETLRVKEIRNVILFHSVLQRRRVTARHDHILGVNLSGTTLHDLGYKHMNIEPGDLYFFNQRDDYERVTVEAGRCFSVHFTTWEPLETDSFCKKTERVDEIVRAIRRVEAAWLAGPRAELQALSEFYALCHRIYQLATAPYAPSDKRLSAAKEHLDLHFREKGVLSEAAALCPVSRRRFNELFRLQYQTTPGRYVTDKRIAYAGELLRAGYFSVSEAADAAGFSDVYYFSRLFHQMTGVTPSEYRKKESPAFS